MTPSLAPPVCALRLLSPSPVRQLFPPGEPKPRPPLLPGFPPCCLPYSLPYFLLYSLLYFPQCLLPHPLPASPRLPERSQDPQGLPHPAPLDLFLFEARLHRLHPDRSPFGLRLEELPPPKTPRQSHSARHNPPPFGSPSFYHPKKRPQKPYPRPPSALKESARPVFPCLSGYQKRCRLKGRFPLYLRPPPAGPYRPLRSPASILKQQKDKRFPRCFQHIQKASKGPPP